jgi:hypothetical protein
MLKNSILAGFLGLGLLGGVVACERQTSKVEVADRDISDRLDRLENDWIRLKGEVQGKSEAEQELDVMKDEIDEGLSGAKKQLKSLGNSAEKGGEKAKDALKKTIDDLERSIEKAKKDLG